MADRPIINAREYANRISPPWLANFFGSRLVVGTLGLFSDLLLEANEQAVTVSWLRRKTLPTDALGPIGANANIAQASGETFGNYRSRLFRKWELWEESATETFAENSLTPFGVDIADVTLLTTRDWTPDASNNWSRWWLLLDGTGGSLPWAEQTWGNFAYGTPGLLWGVTATQDQLFGLIRLLCKWKSAHETGVEILINYGSTLYGVGTWGTPRLWDSDDKVIRWPLGRFWGDFNYGSDSEPYRPTLSRTWGGKIRV